MARLNRRTAHLRKLNFARSNTYTTLKDTEPSSKRVKLNLGNPTEQDSQEAPQETAHLEQGLEIPCSSKTHTDKTDFDESDLEESDLEESDLDESDLCR